MEIEELIPPVSEEAPSGVDFDDDHLLSQELSVLESMVEGEIDPKDGQRLKPRWPQIVKKALELSKRGKNLRVAAILTEGASITEGLAGFRDGLRLIREWCDRYWDSLHPIYDRQPLLQALNREQFLMKSLLGTVYGGREPGDNFVFEDFLRAWDGPGEEPADSRLARLASEMFSKLSPDKKAAALTAVTEALDDAKSIEARFDDKYGTDDSVDFSELRSMLSRSVRLLESSSTDMAASSASVEDAHGHFPAAEAAAFAMPGVAAAAPKPGAMTRATAVAMLDQVIRFFEATEPSSPVPYLLSRAKRCIGKNFMELIDELAGTKDQAEMILKPSSEGE